MSDDRVLIRLLDGPEGGNEIIAKDGDEPPDQIVVFRTQMVTVGVLVYSPDNGEHFAGDLLYQKVSRSELFDRPEFKGHPNVMPGCSYEFVREAVSGVAA